MKHLRLSLRIILVCAAFAGLLIAVPSHAARYQNINSIDALTLRVGDRVGPWTVKKIRTMNEDLPLDNQNVEINFSGKVLLTGKLVYMNSEMNGMNVCMGSFTKASKALLPRIKGTPPDSYFCFRDIEGAQKVFLSSDNGKPISVRISDYTLSSLPAEVWDEATLQLVTQLPKRADVPFDSCGTVEHYASQNWYEDFLNQLSPLISPDQWAALIDRSDACLALDGSMFIALVRDSDFMSNDSHLFRYDVGGKALQEATYKTAKSSFGSFREFKKRQGDFVNITATLGDGGMSTLWEGKYYYKTNTVVMTNACTSIEGKTRCKKVK